MPARRTTFALTAAAAVLLGAPAPAGAHGGLEQRADLPIPEEMFVWAAVVVLVVSFVALAVLWPKPKLERPAWKPLPGFLGGLPSSRPLLLVTRTIGVLLLVLTVVSGFAGPENARENFASTFVYVIFWVGLPFASLAFGDVFRAINPWLALGRAGEWAVERARGGRPRAPRHDVERLGHWPAVAAIVAFAWLELASGSDSNPRDLAVAACVYTALTLAGMARYGAEPWARTAEGFSVYFNLLSRVSPLQVRDGRLGRQAPLSALTEVRPRRGTVALLAALIGSTTFDGFSQGTIWEDLKLDLSNELIAAGASLDLAERAVDTLGLVACILLVAGFYALGVAGARTVGGALGSGRLRGGFAHSLVPIAVVYVIAHYLTFLVFQGQAMAYLASDPLGKGWDLFGTADAAIDFSLLSQNATWYLQVGAVVVGHVAALMLAHDRALTVYPNSRAAVRSQYWMLLVMVGFTTLALYLLASAKA